MSENITDQRPKPQSYLLQSILVTLFCCLPFGIYGIIQAASVDSAFMAGRVSEAYEKSAKAKSACGWGLGLGLSGIIIYFLVCVIFGLSAANFL